MKSKNIYLVIVFLCLCVMGCKKSSSDSSSTDLLSKIVGTYSGTLTMSPGSPQQAWIRISQESGTSNARVAFSLDNSSYQDLGSSFTISGGNTISISSSVAPGSEHGIVDGNSLSFYMGSGYFKGTKQ